MIYTFVGELQKNLRLILMLWLDYHVSGDSVTVTGLFETKLLWN